MRLPFTKKKDPPVKESVTILTFDHSHVLAAILPYGEMIRRRSGFHEIEVAYWHGKAFYPEKRYVNFDQVCHMVGRQVEVVRRED